jgi:hypothetical protein
MAKRNLVLEITFDSEGEPGGHYSDNLENPLSDDQSDNNSVRRYQEPAPPQKKSQRPTAPGGGGFIMKNLAIDVDGLSDLKSEDYESGNEFPEPELKQRM